MSATRSTASVHRTLEIAAILVAAVLCCWLVARLAGAMHPYKGWIVAGAVLAGYIAADLISGLAHWMFDTWGSPDTPVLGRSFIQPFREHHSDPMSITRHGFIETNGNNCIAALPVLVSACVVPTSTRGGLFASALLLSMSVGLLATNQIHKWAHAEDPGWVVRRLQGWRLILSREHHRVHHAAPYATHYCITTGWLNAAFERADVHRRLERGITTVTGVRPNL